ncbi:ISL3 family transposase [Litorivivens sp.]|uniref:ISL3 family transposase n=1 Tax=Litorivivens sp. TaxID=2020868 RepID=UPI003568AAE9
MEDGWLHLHLSRDSSITPRCSVCGRPCPHLHDHRHRRIRDRDFFDCRVMLHIDVGRVRCDTCGVRVQRISWLSPCKRLTRRLQAHAEGLCRLLPIKHVAELLDLSWHTVKTLDKQRLERELGDPDWSSVRRLMMDEFALFKGHRYATVVADADTQEVLWVGEGRSRESIRPFFEQMGRFCRRVEAVAMDMNTAFDLEVQLHCPQAKVVYDLFHVIAKYGREVIDRVRVDQANVLRGDPAARKWVKRGRWVLLKNRCNMTDDQQDYLDQLLAANKPLMTVYLLKEQLKEMWYCRSRLAALRQWKLWWQQVAESGIKPLQDFAKKLKPYLSGILASADHPLSTSKLEGMNNRIKVIKRMAYGYRDNSYFFLKIRAAFHPNMR